MHLAEVLQMAILRLRGDQRAYITPSGRREQPRSGRGQRQFVHSVTERANAADAVSHHVSLFETFHGPEKRPDCGTKSQPRTFRLPSARRGAVMQYKYDYSDAAETERLL